MARPFETSSAPATVASPTPTVPIGCCARVGSGTSATAQVTADSRIFPPRFIGSPLHFEKVLNQLLSMRSEHALGVKLYPLDRQLAMAQSHNSLATNGARRNFKLLREIFIGHDERVVARAGHMRR